MKYYLQTDLREGQASVISKISLLISGSKITKGHGHLDLAINQNGIAKKPLNPV